jgi:hypothetical protein
VDAVHRYRTPLLLTAVWLVVVTVVAGRALPDGPVTSVLTLGPLVAVLLMALVLAVGLRRRHLVPGPARRVHSPVRGRWQALNSPATKVPSHGTRAYGQAYAIDLVHEPADGDRPVFASGAAMRPNDDYPAFGQPVLAMVDGVVVTASDGLRDHRARSSWLGFAYLTLEGAVRELGGPRFIVGNHVVIRSDDGAFALVAHLRRGSVRVRPGDRVRAGEQVAECGNSGNSSEPHVHAQLMDRPSPWTGQGLPMEFRDVAIEGHAASDGVPADGETMVAGGSGVAAGS